LSACLARWTINLVIVVTRPSQSGFTRQTSTITQSNIKVRRFAIDTRTGIVDETLYVLKSLSLTGPIGKADLPDIDSLSKLVAKVLSSLTILTFAVNGRNRNRDIYAFRTRRSYVSKSTRNPSTF
jgi:hypothetical protein